jgi:hypothetical protein
LIEIVWMVYRIRSALLKKYILKTDKQGCLSYYVVEIKVGQTSLFDLRFEIFAMCQYNSTYSLKIKYICIKKIPLKLPQDGIREFMNN